MTWRFVVGIGLVVGLGVVAPSRAEWDQVYGNLGNTGFADIETNIPVAPAWRFSLDGPVDGSGPAIAPDGTVYVATANGTFWGITATGDRRCSFNFTESSIVSTPAVVPGGDVMILVQRRKFDETQASLVRMSADCGVVWEVELPHDEPSLASVTSSSVKVWSFNGEPFFFVHSRNSHRYDPLVDGEDTFHDLLVYDRSGVLFARHAVGRRCVEIGGGGGGWNPFGDLWDWIDGVISPGGAVPPIYEALGWPDSTPAIVDSFITDFSTPSSPLVAVTEHDGSCFGDLNVFQFFPEATKFEERLVRRWEHKVEEDALLSSPAVTADGIIAIGTSNHLVRVYDLRQKEQIWKWDVKAAMMNPPAISPEIWVAATDYYVTILKSSGHLADTRRSNPAGWDSTACGVAMSLNQFVVPNIEEVTSSDFEMGQMAHGATSDRFVNSHPAISARGRLYVVSQPLVNQMSERSELIAF